MRNISRLAVACVGCVALPVMLGAQDRDTDKQAKTRPPVTREMLVNPSPDDWLMYSRTYDAQRFSPLEFVNRRNVSQLKTAWARDVPNGNHEGIPRPGSRPDEFGGLAKINMETGEIQHIDKGAGAGKRRGAGDGGRCGVLGRHQKFRALDAVSGKILWETTIGGSIGNSTITYAVNGK